MRDEQARLKSYLNILSVASRVCQYKSVLNHNQSINLNCQIKDLPIYLFSRKHYIQVFVSYKISSLYTSKKIKTKYMKKKNQIFEGIDYSNNDNNVQSKNNENNNL